MLTRISPALIDIDAAVRSSESVLTSTSEGVPHGDAFAVVVARVVGAEINFGAITT